MVNGIRTGDPQGFNTGCSLKFCVSSQVQQTYQQKRCVNNNKDEENSPKTFYDKNLHTVVRFQVFLSNTNKYMVPSNYYYYYIIMIICLHIVIIN